MLHANVSTHVYTLETGIKGLFCRSFDPQSHRVSNKKKKESPASAGRKECIPLLEDYVKPVIRIVCPVFYRRNLKDLQRASSLQDLCEQEHKDLISKLTQESEISSVSRVGALTRIAVCVSVFVRVYVNQRGLFCASRGAITRERVCVHKHT